MKKITILTSTAFLAVTIVSCSKTSSDYSSGTSIDPPSTTPQLVKVRLVSDWQSLAFSSTTVDGAPALQGQSTLTQIVSYQTGMHKQLAYVKMPGRDGAIYKSLPATYFAQDGNHTFGFSLDFSTFKVTISNADFPARQPNAQNYSNFQYRYIVIPIEVYQSTQVDWNDLIAVSAALNFTL